MEKVLWARRFGGWKIRLNLGKELLGGFCIYEHTKWQPAVKNKISQMRRVLCFNKNNCL